MQRFCDTLTYHGFGSDTRYSTVVAAPFSNRVKAVRYIAECPTSSVLHSLNGSF